jgi:hypothetical protein
MDARPDRKAPGERLAEPDPRVLGVLGRLPAGDPLPGEMEHFPRPEGRDKAYQAGEHPAAAIGPLT